MDFIRANYETSSEEEEEQEEEEHRELPLPEIPTAIGGKYHLVPNLKKYEPSMATRRVLPFKQGEWSTFLYLEWTPNHQQRQLLSAQVFKFNELCRQHNLQIQFEPLHLSSLGSPQPLHVSLSQTISLQTDYQRDQLFERISNQINDKKSSVARFSLHFDTTKLRLFHSLKTRSLFLTYDVSSQTKHESIEPLLACIHRALKETFPTKTNQELARLYEITADNAHMSIAQTLSLPFEFPHTNRDVNQMFTPQTLSPVVSPPTLNVDNLKCDKNREVRTIALPPRQ